MEVTKFNFEDLKVYQKSLELVDSVYNVTNSFPKEEKFGLTSQFVRAATSISLNIAEGSGNSDAQFNRYLQMALDSVRNVWFVQQLQLGKNMLQRSKMMISGKSWLNFQK